MNVYIFFFIKANLIVNRILIVSIVVIYFNRELLKTKKRVCNTRVKINAILMYIIINIRDHIENRPLQNTRSAGRK